ncbi:hypothetical protein H0W26_05970 [Candidatus Dependentiae bacterium]|nr:hypothetical protein [Candidatus Dependentiae bacterium]
MNHHKPFAEIIESSLHSWKGECWEWDAMPTYGSILIVETPTRKVFGLVHSITTGALDATRKVCAYKKTEEELKRDQPHIFHFLHTTFSCLTLGYTERDEAFYQCAPEPPKIHSFISAPLQENLALFFAHEHYLHTLFAHEQATFSLDDMILALLRNLSDKNLLTEEHFSRFIETFSLLTANDYRRLKLFLQRAQRNLTFAQELLD